MGLQSYPLFVPGALISIFHDVNSSTYTSSTITPSNVWRQVTMTASFETVSQNKSFLQGVCSQKCKNNTVGKRNIQK